MMADPEEIRHITWDLDGAQLSNEQKAQRIMVAGFPMQGGVALNMFAIVEGESGGYQKAWHANVVRNADGTIHRVERDGKTFMQVKSVDLGFFQINIDLAGPYVEVEMEDVAVMEMVETLFAENPGLDDPFESAHRAYVMWQNRGFSPWYAYKPGTAKWKLKKKYGAKAFANWLVHSFVGPDPDTGKKLNMDYV